MAGNETVDLSKLRALLRSQHDEQIFYMFDDALELLTPEQVMLIVRRYISAKLLQQIIGPPDTRSLLEQVRAFDASARAGAYYVSFDVNSKNCMTHSKGTRGFIAECCRLFDRCVAVEASADPRELRTAFDLLIDLLRYIDEAHDDVIFFADEGGSWAVSVDWRRVMPAWLGCLSKTSAPSDYASRAIEVIDSLEGPSRDEHLSTAAAVATPEQVNALKQTKVPRRRR